MSLWGWLTGSTDTSKKVVEGVIDAGDALFYTSEEKEKDNQSYREWYLKYLEATLPQNISRRFIALVVTVLWALVLVLGIIAKFSGFDDLSKFCFDVLKDIVSPVFMIVITFYFLKRVKSG